MPATSAYAKTGLRGRRREWRRKLPEPQRAALAVALGERDGSAP
jgi:hypothetical protein